MRLFLLTLLVPVRSAAIDPRYAKNISVFHVNEHKFGAIPVNMNTGDAVGDLFFDLFEVIGSPLLCQNHSTHPWNRGPDPCTNQEAVGENLMVNKLTLEVDSRFSEYGACNVCVNGTDPFHNKCKTDTYSCLCHETHGLLPRPTPCKPTVGESNLYSNMGKWAHGGGCKATLFNRHPSVAQCYTTNIFGKLTPQNPGKWYSTLEDGYCGKNASGNCTWRVVSVDKIVKRACHTKVFGAAVAATAPDCFEACGDQKTNTSSLCWINCFYKAALGPDSDKPGGAEAGMSTEELAAAWQKPFLPVADGGCAAQEEMPPWFIEKPLFWAESSIVV